MTKNNPPKLSFSYARPEDSSDDIVFNFATKPPMQKQQERPGIPLPKEQWQQIADKYMKEISGKDLKAGKDYQITFDPDGCGVSIKMKAALIDPDRRQSAENMANHIMQDYIAKHPELVPAPPADEAKAAPTPQAKDETKEKTVEIKTPKQEGFGVLLDHGPARFQHDKKNKENYFATVEHDGRKVTHWGTDIQRAINESGAKIGDELRLKRTGRESVKITEQVYDDKGVQTGVKEIDAIRTSWKAELPTPTLPSAIAQAPNIAPAPTAKPATEPEKSASTPVLFSAGQQVKQRQHEDHVRRIGETRRAADRAAELARQQRHRNLPRPTIG